MLPPKPASSTRLSRNAATVTHVYDTPRPDVPLGSPGGSFGKLRARNPG